MASLTISLSGSSVVNGSKTWAISDADVQKLADYLVAVSPGAALTPQQALLLWAQTFVSQTVTNVQAYQKLLVSVAPITFS